MPCSYAQPYIEFARKTRYPTTDRSRQVCVRRCRDDGAIGTNVTIDAGAVLEDGVVLGDNARLDPMFGARRKNYDATEIRSGVSLYHGVTLATGV